MELTNKQWMISKIFLPCLKMNLKHKNYKNFIDSLNLLFESVLYQYEWDGTNSKYLDTEYQYHFIILENHTHCLSPFR